MARLLALVLLAPCCGAVRLSKPSEDSLAVAAERLLDAAEDSLMERDAQVLQPAESLALERMSALSAPLLERAAAAARNTTRGRLVIYFVGDSILRYQFARMCKIETGRTPTVKYHDSGATTTCVTNKTYLVYNWNPVLEVGEIIPRMVAEHPAPDVVYFDGGSWLLHMAPYEPMTSLRFQTLQHFQERLTTLFVAWDAVAPRARLEFMTPFTVCTEKLIKKEKRALGRRAEADPRKAARPCVLDVVHEGLATEAVAAPICERFFLNDAGIQNLREASMKTVRELPWPLNESARVVDQYPLTAGHCNMSEDGVHFMGLIDEQLDVFFSANGW
uniref:Uncharacterized protein n=1 Tax=Alexandrium catenella TaxID=2925 RepID=A0A7S1PVB3_ALECA|mmetsp:Transcript_112515/g.298932  ORF Transcript_112515/g.298932 Transcript_112515/m.298932 type:complete len:332 (+) Transcript_112515:106-1101(+)